MAEQEIFIPAPIRGMTSENAFLNPQEGWARLVRNFAIKQGGLVGRGVQYNDAEITPVSGSPEIIWHDIDNNHYLWSDGKITNSDGTLVYTGTISTAPVFECTTYRDQVYLLSSGQAAINRNNLTWGAFPFTLNTLTASTIKGAVPHKGRIFFWGANAIEYSDLDAITGNTQYFPLSSFLRGGSIVFCRSVTITAGLQAEEAFCIYADNGIVLVYKGSAPDQAEWYSLGSFKATPPASAQGFIDIDGDSIIMGREYVYSTRDLFADGGKAAQRNSISLPIASLYKQMLSPYNPNGVTKRKFAFYHPQHDALVFNTGHAEDVMWSDDTAQGVIPQLTPYRRCQLVYFRETQAWAVWDIPQLNYPVKQATASSPIVYWCIGSARFYYFINRGISDHLAPYGSLAADEDNPGVELVWRTPIFEQLLNAQVLGIRSSVRVGTTVSGALNMGVIGNGADRQINSMQTDQNTFIADASITKISTAAAGVITGGNINNSVRVDVGLQETYFGAFLRMGLMTDASENNQANPEINNMTVYYEPGGTV